VYTQQATGVTGKAKAPPGDKPSGAEDDGSRVRRDEDGRRPLGRPGRPLAALRGSTWTPFGPPAYVNGGGHGPKNDKGTSALVVLLFGVALIGVLLAEHVGHRLQRGTGDLQPDVRVHVSGDLDLRVAEQVLHRDEIGP